MSTKNTITRTAAALAGLETALEATRQEHAGVSTTAIEAKLTAIAEVVRNTHRKMARPSGFDWALHHSFTVVAITDTHLTVEALKGREKVTLTIARSDLSMSTWEITATIRRRSEERMVMDLYVGVTNKQEPVAKIKNEIQTLQKRLVVFEAELADAQQAVKRRQARNQVIEAKRAAARARRKNTPVLVAVP